MIVSIAYRYKNEAKYLKNLQKKKKHCYTDKVIYFVIQKKRNSWL